MYIITLTKLICYNPIVKKEKGKIKNLGHFLCNRRLARKK